MTRQLNGVLLWCATHLFLVASVACAQTASITQPVILDRAQQSALGISTSAVVPAGQQSLLAAATVTVPPGRVVMVTAPFPSVITQLHAGLGDSVRTGAALATISSPQLAQARQHLREAELEALNADAALQREQAMHDEGIIPSARLQTTQRRQQAAEMNWQAQRAALQTSGLLPGGDIASGQIASPRSGVVTDVQASVGQRVEAGAELFRIANLDQMELDITLSAEKANRLRVGDPISVPSHDAKGILLGVNRSLNAAQQARARARITQAGRLQVGQAVQVQLHPALNTHAMPAWQVPARSVFEMRGQQWVLVATTTGYTPTVVQVISTNDESAVVEGQLNDQQRVASTGLAALRQLLQKAD